MNMHSELLRRLAAEGRSVVSAHVSPTGRSAHGVLAGGMLMVSTPSRYRGNLLVELADGTCAIADRSGGRWMLEFGDVAIGWGVDEHGAGFAHRHGGDVVRIVWHGELGTELVAADLHPRTLVAALVALLIEWRERAALQLLDPVGMSALALR